MMRTLLNRLALDRQVMVHVAVALLVVAGIVAIGLGPLRRRFLALDADIAEQEKTMARNVRVLSPASRDTVVRDFRVYGDALRKKGSTAEESAAMLAEVETLAAQAKISLGGTKPETQVDDPDSEQYSVALEFEADMSQLVGFLYAIETSPRMLRIKRLALEAKGARTSGAIKCSALVTRVVTL